MMVKIKFKCVTKKKRLKKEIKANDFHGAIYFYTLFCPSDVGGW
jgi:hypothetical protein